jgi:hypothetical protein
MRVQIDQPRHDNEPAHIDDLGAASAEVVADFDDLCVAKSDVGLLIAPGRWVDDTAAFENQIRHLHASNKIRRCHRLSSRDLQGRR